MILDNAANTIFYGCSVKQPMYSNYRSNTPVIFRHTVFEQGFNYQNGAFICPLISGIYYASLTLTRLSSSHDLFFSVVKGSTVMFYIKNDGSAMTLTNSAVVPCSAGMIYIEHFNRHHLQHYFVFNL